MQGYSPALQQLLLTRQENCWVNSRPNQHSHPEIKLTCTGPRNHFIGDAKCRVSENGLGLAMSTKMFSLAFKRLHSTGD